MTEALKETEALRKKSDRSTERDVRKSDRSTERCEEE